MKETKLIFEKVGDVNATYPYLCIYDENDRVNPFMEIAVTDNKELQYTIYAGIRNVFLTADDWNIIQKKALEFLSKVLTDESFA